ncbi:membrane lipoprotein lipid attachment site-containing protein [Bacillus subtilis]|uniref:membrane lipoprotein lipid attachment site-containing protein n=1 Tax=Bacillus subtilis TaxID=1423 RepID=UPI0024C165B8|nr:membrane lipoprotein lipid attachment site-containing protein [Bacillus subtilis]WHY10113.1 membrane lipoprotein lipid attachment site-containing protein [Bacillus subtilis]WPP26191.1 membrane lipoprotein lipid attachment site-containing protein [Bacillus subtilis]
MRRILSIFVFAIMLAGCSSNASTEKQHAGGEKTVKAEPQSTSSQKDSTDNYQPNSQVTDDRSLLKVGQTFLDDKGKAVLKDIKQVNKTYKIGDVELTVKEMKLIHLRPDYSMIDYFHELTHDEEFDFVKVFVDIKNTSSKKVNVAPIALMKTNTGETFDWNKDIYLEELNGELEGGAEKSGNLGFIVNASSGHAHDKAADAEKKTKEIKWIEITTSDVFDHNHKKTSDAQKIKIKF